MIRVATDERCSVSLAELRRDHTIIDLIDYYEGLDFADDRSRPQDGDG